MDIPEGYVIVYDQGQVFLVRIEDYNEYVPVFDERMNENE